MGDLTKFGDYSHQSTMLARASRKFSLKNFFAMLLSDGTNNLVINSDGSINTKKVLPTTPTIISVTTTNSNWTALNASLSDVIKWRISELTGLDFYYAYVAAPGNNFSVGFGWVAEDSSPSAIYIKRPGSANITLKLEVWKA